MPADPILGAPEVAVMQSNLSSATPLPPLRTTAPAPHPVAWQYTQEVYDAPLKYPKATVISRESPRAVLLPGFLSAAEVEHLIHAASGGFQRSEVVAEQTFNEHRTSYGAW